MVAVRVTEATVDKMTFLLLYSLAVTCWLTADLTLATRPTGR